MQSLCSVTGEEFEISEAELRFCSQHDLPLPVKSPTERLREMAVFLNMFHLYRTQCVLTGRSILSWIPPQAGWRVAAIDAWEKDDWDDLACGRDFDFRRPFFEQFHDLVRTAPVYNLSVVYSTLENSDYTNCITGAKDSYLCFASSEIRDCLYAAFTWRSRDIVDCVYAYDCELCYDCFDIRSCYRLKHCTNCIGCSDSTLLQSCSNCRSCFGCVNLANKEYHFFNQPLSRSEYCQALGALDLGSWAVLQAQKERFSRFAKRFPKRAVVSKNVENCTGNYIFNSKNCSGCNFVNGGENIEHGMLIEGGRSSIVWGYYGNQGELIYNSSSTGDSAYNIRFCHDVWMNVANLEYCMFCGYGTKDCFGCSALKRRQYCILNKQYGTDDYFKLRSRIVAHMKKTGEWGRFFPSTVSPHSYNRSGADFFLPLSKEEALRRGFAWEEESEDQAGGLPDGPPPQSIDELQESDLPQTYICSETHKGFKILKRELEFYRQLRIPPPRVGPLQRLRHGARRMQARRLLKTSCRSCGKETLTVYDPQQEIVFCERCFAEELY